MMTPQVAAGLWRLDREVWRWSLGLLGLIWLGYPLVLAGWRRVRAWHPQRTPRVAPPEAWPQVTVIVSAHNEGAHIAARVRNLWEQSYPAGRVEIVVSEDGSCDDTAMQVRGLAAAGGPMPLRLLSRAERRGKAAAINGAVEAAAGEVLVFTDANNLWSPEALRHLVAPFADASVGAVTGRKAVAATTGLGGGESVYWRYEGWLVTQETATGSTVAAYGEALAVRRECFVPLPTAAMVNDDLYLAVQVLSQGRRVVAAAEAGSLEHGAAGEREEWERRCRMAAGHWGALAGVRWWRLPAGVGLKLLFHEILRPLSGLWLGLACVAGLALLAMPAEAGPMGALGRGMVMAEGLGLAWVGAVGAARWRGGRLGKAEAPYFFCLALAASLAGLARMVRRRQSPLWQRVARAAPAESGLGTEPTLVGAGLSAGSLPALAPPRVPLSRAGAGVGTTARILNGLFWAANSFVLGKVLVFGAVVVLARILAPRAFGEVALAVSTVTVLEILGTLGLTSALIFEEQDVAAAANWCFWITLATSVGETVLGWVLAPELARFFHEPALTGMLRTLASCLILMALGNTHDTLLRRQLAFRTKFLPDVAQAAAKGGASIGLALVGLGAWSLIWGQVLGTAVATAVLWRMVGWRPGWQWDAAVGRRMASYAKHIYLLDGSSVLLGNFDVLTIGRMLSDAWLGFYSLAFRIPEVLLHSVLNVITRVVFPALSRMQNETEELRQALLDTVRYTSMLTLPVAAGIGITARELVFGVYGWHWGPSIRVLEVLALYAGIRCITHPFGDAYKAMGRPDILTRTTLAWWVLLPPSVILGARWGGIVGVAWGQVATRAGMSLLHVYLINRCLSVRLTDLWRCLAPALEGTAAMAVGLALLAPRLAGWAPRPELAVMALAGLTIYALTLRWRHPRMVEAMLARVRGMAGTLAAPEATGLGTAATAPVVPAPAVYTAAAAEREA